MQMARASGQDDDGGALVYLAAVVPIALPGLLNGSYQPSLLAAGAGWYWLADLAHFVLVPALLVAWLRRHGRWRPAELGLAWPDPRWGVGELAGLALASTLVFALCYEVGREALVALLPAAPPAPSPDVPLPVAGTARALTVAYLALSAALVEEVTYRALPWCWARRALAPRWRVPVYVLSSSVVFGLIHEEQGLAAIIATATLGAAACQLYLRMGSLWPLVAAHLAVDLWSFW